MDLVNAGKKVETGETLDKKNFLKNHFYFGTQNSDYWTLRSSEKSLLKGGNNKCLPSIRDFT